MKEINYDMNGDLRGECDCKMYVPETPSVIGAFGGHRPIKHKILNLSDKQLSSLSVSNSNDSTSNVSSSNTSTANDSSSNKCHSTDTNDDLSIDEMEYSEIIDDTLVIVT